MSRPTQALPASLAAPIDATVTSFSIRGLKDSLGNPIISMIGSIMHATIEPRSTGNQEIITWTSIANLGNNLITVGGVTRNIDPRYPHAALTGTMNHAAGVEIILSDTSKMWDEYPNKNEANTIVGQFTYSTRPRSTGADTDPTALVTKAELAAASITPGALGNITVSGVAGEAITTQLVVWNDPASGKWKVANGNVLAELNGTELGIALGSAVTDAAITPGVALRGRVSGFSALAVGPVYVSDIGTVSNTPGTNSLQIGIAVSATDIIFDPYLKKVLNIGQSDALVGSSGTPSSTNKFVTQDSLTPIQNSVIDFGGTGADGALTISSGTTTLDMAGAKIFQKNYSSISITGTGKLTFSNPHPNGTLIFIRCSGNATLTSSIVPMIDARGMGGATGGAAGVGVIFTANGGGAGASSGVVSGGNLVSAPGVFHPLAQQYSLLLPGGGGGNGFGANAGGAGGGALVLQVAGTLTFTTVGGISVSGLNGASNGGANSGAGGGGGGTAFIMYITAGTITGTVTSASGAGASGFAGDTGGGGGAAWGGNGGSGGAGPGGDGANGTSYLGLYKTS